MRNRLRSFWNVEAISLGIVAVMAISVACCSTKDMCLGDVYGKYMSPDGEILELSDTTYRMYKMVLGKEYVLSQGYVTNEGDGFMTFNSLKEDDKDCYLFRNNYTDTVKTGDSASCVKMEYYFPNYSGDLVVACNEGAVEDYEADMCDQLSGACCEDGYCVRTARPYEFVMYYLNWLVLEISPKEVKPQTEWPPMYDGVALAKTGWLLEDRMGTIERHYYPDFTENRMSQRFFTDEYVRWSNDSITYRNKSYSKVR